MTTNVQACPTAIPSCTTLPAAKGRGTAPGDAGAETFLDALAASEAGESSAAADAGPAARSEAKPAARPGKHGKASEAERSADEEGDEAGPGPKAVVETASTNDAPVAPAVDGSLLALTPGTTTDATSAPGPTDDVAALYASPTDAVAAAAASGQTQARGSLTPVAPSKPQVTGSVPDSRLDPTTKVVEGATRPSVAQQAPRATGGTTPGETSLTGIAAPVPDGPPAAGGDAPASGSPAPQAPGGTPGTAKEAQAGRHHQADATPDPKPQDAAAAGDQATPPALDDIRTRKRDADRARRHETTQRVKTTRWSGMETPTTGNEAPAAPAKSFGETAVPAAAAAAAAETPPAAQFESSEAPAPEFKPAPSDPVGVEGAVPAALAAGAKSALSPAAQAHADKVVELATPIRFDDLIEKLQGEIRSGRNEFKIAIDPPELGKLDVSVIATGEGVVVRLVAERHDAAQWLKTDLPALHKSLEQDGLHVLGVEVRSSADYGAQARHEHQKQAPLHEEPASFAHRAAKRPRETPPASLRGLALSSHGIDLIV